MPKERVVTELIISKATAAGPDVSIRRFAGEPIIESTAGQVTLDMEKAESIVALANEQARQIGHQYLGAGDLSVAKNGEGINTHIAVQAWPQSALTFLAQLNQGKVTSLERQPLLLFETWQNMLDTHLIIQSKARSTVKFLERERSQALVTLEEEMTQATQRSAESQASVRDLRNCQNNISKVITETEDCQRRAFLKWADERLDLVSQGKVYFETMAAQQKNNVAQIENKAHQHKFTIMPKLTKDWLGSAQYLYNMITATLRQRIIPALVNTYDRDRLGFVMYQNFAKQPGLTLNALVTCLSELIKADVQTYKLQASTMYLGAQTHAYGYVRQNMLFQAGGQLLQQWCMSALTLPRHDIATEQLFRAAILLSVLVDEAESIDTGITGFHDMDYTRNLQKATAYRDQNISVALERSHVSLDAIDKALADNSDLASCKRKLTDWTSTWERLRNDMPAIVAALSPTQNRWFKLTMDEHKARMNEITIDIDIYSVQKILVLLKGGV